MLTPNKCQSEKIDYLQQLILRLFGLVYSLAFCSWYGQIHELYSKSGLLPIENIKLSEKTPTLLFFWQNEKLLYILCILGTILGLLIFLNKVFVKWYIFILLWVFYLSIYTIGQDFSQFQWDIMLLEGGFICIIYCIWNNVGRELLRWLAFRLYFSSGLVKLLSQCPTWWDLTALHYHFSSQCIPHFLSWWAHQLPSEMKKLMVASNFYILLFGSLYLYFPLRSIRIYGFILQLIMQISIILTGNYNFFNILSIIITMSVLDDYVIYKYFPKQIKKFIGISIINEFEERKDNKMKKNIEIGICLYMTGVIMFNMFPYETIMQNKKLPFTIKDIANDILTEDTFTYFSLYILSFFFYYLTYFNLQNSHLSKSVIKSALSTLLKIIIFIFMFSMSFMVFQFGIGIKDIHSPLIPQEYIIFQNYGLFRKMTGVNGRPELIFQGSNDGKQWQEYEFYYKPGKISEISPFVVPHQPRLDWQLWFASFSDHPQDLYLIRLIYKMLDGQNVKEYVSYNPFPKGPKFIRIHKYLYFYTNISEMITTNNFWKRQFKNEYLPPLSLYDNQLQEIKKKYKFSNINEPVSILQQIPLKILIIISLLYVYFL